MVLVHVGYLVLPVFGSVRNRGTVLVFTPIQNMCPVYVNIHCSCWLAVALAPVSFKFDGQAFLDSDPNRAGSSTIWVDTFLRDVPNNVTLSKITLWFLKKAIRK